MLRVTDDVVLDDRELAERFVRSAKPGGQRVNKVSTAVELRFDAARSPSLPASAKAMLRKLAGRRWTAGGAVVIRVEESRSQARNREIARERLAELVRRALVVPKRRRATAPSLAARKRRVEAKKMRGEVKRLRRPVRGAD